MQTLIVKKLDKEDAYTDTARIAEKYRLDDEGKMIPEGRVCKVSIGRNKLLSLRGNLKCSEPTICLDDITRNALGVSEDQKVEVRLHQAWWIGQFLWAWRASDPAYRIAARFGLLSLLLGAIGVILGFAGVMLGVIALTK